MTAQTENQPPVAPESAACHPSVRRWIYLRGALIGLLVGAWWIFFAPDDLMESSLKITLGLVAAVIATGSYLFNLRQTLWPSTKSPAAGERAGSAQE